MNNPVRNMSSLSFPVSLIIGLNRFKFTKKYFYIRYLSTSTYSVHDAVREMYDWLYKRSLINVRIRYIRIVVRCHPADISQ